MNIRGLKLGGRIRRDMTAIALYVPLASYHRPGQQCWSWGLDWERYRRSSGLTHSWFRIVLIHGFQSGIFVDVLKLGSFHFMRQTQADAKGAAE